MEEGGGACCDVGGLIDVILLLLHLRQMDGWMDGCVRQPLGVRGRGAVRCVVSMRGALKGTCALSSAETTQDVWTGCRDGSVPTWVAATCIAPVSAGSGDEVFFYLFYLYSHVSPRARYPTSCRR